MELRQYWNVIWKRRWLVLAIIGLTTILSGLLAATAKLNYEADTRFITRQQPTEDNSRSMVFTFDRYYNWFGSEFLVDDYTQIVASDAFAASVLQELPKGYSMGKDQGKLTVNDVKQAIQSDRKQRELHIKVTAPTREDATLVSQAAATVLTDARLKPLRGQMVDDRAVFAQIDEATGDEVKSSRSREIINAVIRIVVGLVGALALAFLLEYMDTSVRDERDAEKLLDLPVLGAIPRVR